MINKTDWAHVSPIRCDIQIRGLHFGPDLKWTPGVQRVEGVQEDRKTGQALKRDLLPLLSREAAC